MAAHGGTAGSVVAIIGGGTVVIGEVHEWSADFTMAPVDRPAFGRTWLTRVSSMWDGGGSFSANRDDTNAGQGSINAYFLAGSALVLRLYDGTTLWSGSALITGTHPTITQDGGSDTAYDWVSSQSWTLA